MSNEQTRSHGVMEGKGAYNRYAKLPAGGGALSSRITDRPKGKTRWSPCKSQSRVCVGASVQVAPSLCTTLTNRRTTSTCYSLFWMLTRTDTSWTTQTYFRVRLEDHST